MTDAPEQSTRRVLEAVARHLQTDVGTLRGRERTQTAVGARWVAIAVLRDRCGLSYRQIARELGRAHPTIINSLRYALTLPRTVELVEHVDRMMRQEAPRTRRAVVDIEEVFARAREDVGAPRAKLPPKPPR